jgi:hypothetical protein
MNLRSGAIIDTSNFQTDFVNSFYQIKLQYRYRKLFKKTTLDTKYTIANLYIGFKTFYNREYTDKQHFILYLSSNILLNYRNNSETETCYICGCNNSDISLYCQNNHIVHLECFYQQLLNNITKSGLSFSIPNDPQRCDYCDAKFSVNS